MLICIHEDRLNALGGVELLLLSLRAHCPDVPVSVTYTREDDRARSWMKRFSQVTVNVDRSLHGHGWSTKPLLLLRALEEGVDEVVWLDSDLILAGDFRPLLRDRRPEEIVVGEDFWWGLYPGSAVRTGLWGLPPGRVLPFTVNSGFVRVTKSHRDLLTAWAELLRSDEYCEAQKVQPMDTRPLHVQGDQDVLTALLGSAAFQHIPVVYLRRGRDIIQFIGPGGYTIGERVRNLWYGLPSLIHSVEPKPWSLPRRQGFTGRIQSYYHRLCVDTGPYAWAARSFLSELQEDLPALCHPTRVGRWVNWLSMGNPALSGLPLALYHSAGKRIKRMLGLTPWPRSKVEAALESRRQLLEGQGRSARVEPP